MPTASAPQLARGRPLSTATPEQVLESIVIGINSGNLQSHAALRERGGIRNSPGSLAHGAPGVREALTGFISMKGKLDLEVTRVLEVDDLALVIGVWSIRRHRTRGRTGAAGGKERGCPA